MKHTFQTYLLDNYDKGIDFEWSDVPYTYENLNWLIGQKPSEEEISAAVDNLNAEEPYRQLRLIRDQKLRDCDWITLKSYSQGVAVPEAWATYQQQLRDITSQTPLLDDNGLLIIDSVVWPSSPEE